MKICANRMDLGFEKYKQEYEEAALRVLRSGWYVLGNEVASFEREFADFNVTNGEAINSSSESSCTDVYCASLASGLDALWIGMKLLGISHEDEVIVQGNTYIASVMGITINGATPVFVEPGEDYQIDPGALECALTPKTKAVMVVHLYGQVTDMTKIVDFCKKNHLLLIEDCAQAHGAMWKNQKVGTFGDIGCFSFYPTKNLGAFGDAGAIISHNKELIEEVKTFRNYGSHKRYYNKVVGANSRLDEIQAALLRVKLKYLLEINEERCKIANTYTQNISNEAIIIPQQRMGGTPVWHQYVVRCKERDRLKNYLEQNDIATIIHYPIPPYKQEAYQYLHLDNVKCPFSDLLADEVLSLPMYEGMPVSDLEVVIKCLNSFN